jgi:hypothetical protein
MQSSEMLAAYISALSVTRIGRTLNDEMEMICKEFIAAGWSQWSRELSSPARTLGSWVRIPFKAWMFLCVYSLFVLFCV